MWQLHDPECLKILPQNLQELFIIFFLLNHFVQDSYSLIHLKLLLHYWIHLWFQFFHNAIVPNVDFFLVDFQNIFCKKHIVICLICRCLLLHFNHIHQNILEHYHFLLLKWNRQFYYDYFSRNICVIPIWNIREKLPISQLLLFNILPRCQRNALI